MSAIVVYTSKYGSTEQYARWTAEALGCPAKKLAEVSAGELAACDTVIYGGSLLASSVRGFKKFLGKLGGAKPQTLALFTVGMTSPSDRAYYAEVEKQNIPAAWQGHIRMFALRGNQMYSRMGGLHRLLLKLPKAEAEKKPPAERTAEDIELIERFGKDVVLVSREQLAPLLDYLKTA